MTMRDFIKQNRRDIDTMIQMKLNINRNNPDTVRLNDNDRREWIMNDEGLYGWAQMMGVRV